MSFINWGEETPEQKAARRYFEEQQALFEQAVRFSRTTGAMAGVGTGGGSTIPATFTFKSNSNELKIRIILPFGEWWNDQSKERNIVIDWGDGITETITFTFVERLLSHTYDKQNEDKIKINLTVDFNAEAINFSDQSGNWFNQLTELTLGELPNGLGRMELFFNNLVHFDIAAPLPSSLYYLNLQNNQLTSFDASKLAPTVQRFLLDSNRLTTDAVNNVLISLNEKYTVPPDLTLPQVFTLGMSSQYYPAPPTGAGLAAKTSLQARGYNVYTD